MEYGIIQTTAANAAARITHAIQAALTANAMRRQTGGVMEAAGLNLATATVVMILTAQAPV